MEQFGRIEKGLTRRERQAVECLVEGMSYKEIGEAMGISWQTVRYHLHQAYTKLGVNGNGAKVRVILGALRGK